jgi:hypothetical protein
LPVGGFGGDEIATALQRQRRGKFGLHSAHEIAGREANVSGLRRIALIASSQRTVESLAQGDIIGGHQFVSAGIPCNTSTP